MSFNKLIRDKIPDIIKSKGEIATIRIMQDDEYYKELNKKLQEEVDEFFESESNKELADILEVVYALAKAKNCTEEQLNSIRNKKRELRGGFDKKIFLEK